MNIKMRAQVEHIIKTLTNPKIRALIKKNHRRFRNKLKFGSKKTNIYGIRDVLIKDFNVKRGDNLIISSSFGNLNADFSPLELIKLLQEIVGTKGNIVMPFYPPVNSNEWASSGKIFDMKETRSGMGVLTQVFSEMPGVLKSIHPTKAVVAWGANANEIIKSHHFSKTPFDWESPYGWLLKNNSKSIGLGIKSLPMFHACEDVIYKNIDFYKQKTQLLVRDYNNNLINCDVYIHDKELQGKLIPIGDYIYWNSPKSYITRTLGYNSSYVIDNQELFKFCQNNYNNNRFRYKK